MRRFVLLGVMLVLVFAKQVFADGKVSIKEYAPKEFAVKGPIETQVNALVNNIKNDPVRKPDTVLQIFVEGFADRSGFSPENDKYAKDRAEGIAAVLSREFPEPEAKIKFVSRGDAADKRQVIVEWKYVPIPLVPAVPGPSEKQTEQTLRKKIYIVIGIVLAAGVIFVFLIRVPGDRKRKVKKVINGTQWIKDLDVGNETYHVKVEVKNGILYSPFTTKSGMQITQDNKRKLIQSLKGCLKKEEFKTQKEELIQKGIIRT